MLASANKIYPLASHIYMVILSGSSQTIYNTSRHLYLNSFDLSHLSWTRGCTVTTPSPRTPYKPFLFRSTSHQHVIVNKEHKIRLPSMTHLHQSSSNTSQGKVTIVFINFPVHNKTTTCTYKLPTLNTYTLEHI